MAILEDISLNADEYTEVYAASGATPAQALNIQNKTGSHVYVQYSSGKPTGTDDNGFILRDLEVWSVPTGNDSVWLRGNGKVAVEAL